MQKKHQLNEHLRTLDNQFNDLWIGSNITSEALSNWQAELATLLQTFSENDVNNSLFPNLISSWRKTLQANQHLLSKQQEKLASQLAEGMINPLHVKKTNAYKK